MVWIKVQAHLKRPPESGYEVLNEEMDSLTKSVHQNHWWKTKSYAQYFGSATMALIVDQLIVTELAGKALQRVYHYHGPMMQSELCKNTGDTRSNSIHITDWESFGSVSRNFDDTDCLQHFKVAHGYLPVMRQKNRLK